MSTREFIEATLRRLGTESERPCPAEDEAREIEEQARCAAVRQAVAMAQAWLRDLQDPPEELLRRVRELALLATEEQRADRRDPEREGARRGWWRATFLLAQALGLDPFGRTWEQLGEQVAAGAWPWAPAERRGEERPTCAGLRKDGASCGGRPRHGSEFCRHHQGQAPTPAIAVELDPEAAFDAEVEAWLKAARRARRSQGDERWTRAQTRSPQPGATSNPIPRATSS